MENNSKQAVLSIVGIAILVIAVVGVSFAFFSYSKTGTANNVITTGSITFAYNETNNISLTNQFPQSTDEGKTNDAFNFNVTGNLPSTPSPVSYTVTAVAGDAVGSKTRMADSEIDVIVTSTGDGVVSGNYATGATAGNSTTGFQIATGTIPADGTTHTHNYAMTMWVNESVTVSDTDTDATYCASADECTGGRDVYSDMYYSLKVNVEAQG